MGKASNRKKKRLNHMESDLTQRGEWLDKVTRQVSDMVTTTWQQSNDVTTVERVMAQLFRGADQYVVGFTADLQSIYKKGHKDAKVDCKPGCSYCCHIEVTVSAPEVIAIVQFVEREFDDSQRAALRKRVIARNIVSRSMTDTERASSRQPCPFLVDKMCSIYPVRPFTCRGHHSTSVNACQQDFEGRPNVKVQILTGFGEAIYPFVNGSLDSFMKMGQSIEPLWFSLAMEIGLYQTGALEQWCGGGNPFAPASKVDYERMLARRPAPSFRVIG